MKPAIRRYPQLTDPSAAITIHTGGIVVYPPGSTFGPRTNATFEFVWIMQGNCRIRYDATEIAAPADTLLLCRPGMTDYYEWDKAGKTVHAYIHFSMETHDRFWPPAQTWPLYSHLPAYDMVRPLFRHVLAHLSIEEPERTFLLAPCLEAMLKAFVMRRLTGGDATREDRRQRPTSAALALMQEAVLRMPAEVISLGRLAKRANVSPEHLCRLFQKEFGAGPLQHYRRMRLQRATILLGRSNMSIKEIAYAAGFANPYHFSRAFRQTYGKSPRAFRTAGDDAASGDRPVSGA